MFDKTFERHERTHEQHEMRGHGPHRGRHHPPRGHRGPNGPHPHGMPGYGHESCRDHGEHDPRERDTMHGGELRERQHEREAMHGEKRRERGHEHHARRERGMFHGMRHNAATRMRGEEATRPGVDANTCPMCDMHCSLDEPGCRRGADFANKARD